MKDIGTDTAVVYPVSVTHALVRKEKLPPKEWTRTTRMNNEIEVFSPRIITLSTPSNINLRHLITAFNNAQFRRAVDKVIRKKSIRFSVAYGHFISPSGVTAVWVGNKYGCCSCFAYGENTSYTIDELGEKRARHLLSGVDSVIAVSSDKAEYLREHQILRPEIVQVIANAVNREEFHSFSKQEMRKNLVFRKTPLSSHL